MEIAQINYQVMPPLSDKEYQELKDDIAARGVMVPIEYDDLGNILDGHHRVKACQELGITVWPRLIRQGMTDDQKRSHALMLNLARRHLTNEQRKPLWIEMRQSGMTLEAIAKADGTVSKQTVMRALDNQDVFQMENVPPTITDTKGRKQPTKKPRKPQTIYVSIEVAEKAESLPEKHKEAVLTGQKKPMEAARDAKIDEISRTVTLPEAKYRIVYADPPWSYGNTQPDYHTEQRDHYPVMKLDDICSMPIKDMCEDNAVLFLWVTSPILEESFQVVNSWGFTYKASFVWDKVKHNMGHYNSVRHEFILVCTRGSCQPDIRKLYDSVITEERSEHSKKPDFVYQIIETLYPYGKRLELFSRQYREGWDAYGNQANA
jgi:N6-adenosine-specific RNA methylase IME4/ParB-like chromosome segregation protein Spo0J